MDSIEHFVRLFGDLPKILVLDNQLLDLPESSETSGARLLAEVGRSAERTDRPIVRQPFLERVPVRVSLLVVLVEVGEDGEDLMELLSAQRMNLLHHLLMEYYFEVGGRITQLL